MCVQRVRVFALCRHRDPHGTPLPTEWCFDPRLGESCSENGLQEQPEIANMLSYCPTCSDFIVKYQMALGDTVETDQPGGKSSAATWAVYNHAARGHEGELSPVLTSAIRSATQTALDRTVRAWTYEVEINEEGYYFDNLPLRTDNYNQFIAWLDGKIKGGLRNGTAILFVIKFMQDPNSDGEAIIRLDRSWTAIRLAEITLKIPLGLDGKPDVEADGAKFMKITYEASQEKWGYECIGLANLDTAKGFAMHVFGDWVFGIKFAKPIWTDMEVRWEKARKDFMEYVRSKEGYESN
ncbi:hypothetical protein F5Y16DRAFT_422645 [Xylariaceae sp. FL0255]|nr:hypothetical protein F5Y16DRAFT_422645 [Xylariaceae sp. FL0255]